ncbi:hypothetical protein [Streptomyces sp. N35]|uniref:hypothetical protein n=1 Tax=Streptomyces sp. N35 TaxID=2795730 RepID=UPI0018F6ED65|nr:hypothetical protein [Streptomyces sp. N35]
MEEQVETPVGERVELVYTPTRDDLTQAFKERAKVSVERWLRKLAPAFLALAAVVFVADLVRGEGLDLGMLGIACVLGFMAYGFPVVLGRQSHKLAAQHGEYRVAVDATGCTITHDVASGHTTWRATPRFAESRDVFVLLSGDLNATCLVVLPKRAVQAPGDTDTLRALLDRHSTRV